MLDKKDIQSTCVNRTHPPSDINYQETDFPQCTILCFISVIGKSSLSDMDKKIRIVKAQIRKKVQRVQIFEFLR